MTNTPELHNRFPGIEDPAALLNALFWPLENSNALAQSQKDRLREQMTTALSDAFNYDAALMFARAAIDDASLDENHSDWGL